MKLLAVLALAAGGWASEPGYVASAACVPCHAPIYRSYAQTGMGRSFAEIGNVPPSEGGYYHARSERHYTVLRRDGRYFLRRHQAGPGGAVENIVEKEIHYLIGSGNHARTYLHRAPNGRLIELPLSWYTERGGYWAMSPGYDSPNHQDFRRTVSQDCLFCHNAFPQPNGEPAPGIDCQRCHGPGAAHLDAAKSGAPVEKIRAAIVNPARLTPERKLEVCLQCHLETTSRPLPNAIRRYGRAPFSYRPGEPIGDYVLHFDHAPGAPQREKFEINSAGYRFLHSKCFTASGGALTCTTCHDPHRIPRGEAARRHYDAACQGCHTSVRNHVETRDCARCHMPKRRAEDAVHAIMTDHWIQRRLPAGNPLAPLDELALARKAAYQGPVELYYPPALPDTPLNRLYLAAAQVKEFSNLRAGIPRLEKLLAEVRPAEGRFYLDLAEALRVAGDHDRAIDYYRAALERDPRLGAAHHRLGELLLRRGETARAIQALERGASLAPEEEDILVALGVAYGQAGRLGDSLNALRRATELNPDHAAAWLNLGVSLEQKQDWAGAERAYREAIRVQPDYPAAHRHLGNLLAALGRPDEARRHHDRAMRLAQGR